MYPSFLEIAGAGDPVDLIGMYPHLVKLCNEAIARYDKYEQMDSAVEYRDPDSLRAGSHKQRIIHALDSYWD